jgi:hypothetical protein
VWNYSGAARATETSKWSKEGVIVLTLIKEIMKKVDCLCGLVVRVPGYRFRGPDSILGAIRFSEK